MKTIIISLVLSVAVFAQVKFDGYFIDKTLRIDYSHTADSTHDYYSIDQLKEEPFWGGTKTNLTDSFNYGAFVFKAYDDSTNTLIFNHTYSSMLNEWQTTDEAKHTSRNFEETVIMPFPKHKIRVEFYTRNKEHIPVKKYVYKIDPNNYFIKHDNNYKFPTFKVHFSGDPSTKVDIVILPEGYTKEQMGKFKKDCEKFAGYLFKVSPYDSNSDKFNIWGVEAASKDSGTDVPGKGIWKNTLLGTTFYTFDEERYCLTPEDKIVRDVASNAPYDQIYILVNTEKYGGGGLYNFYNICTSDNKNSEFVFTHEFGHGFAFLGDEYYTSSIAYNDFYPKGVEPLEPNLTTMVDFASKWKSMVADTIPIPTPNTKEYKDVVGVFEGGGYVEKGVYRPAEVCSMHQIVLNHFCLVCKAAIQKMIDYYTK
jgi:hypothetical protein